VVFARPGHQSMHEIGSVGGWVYGVAILLLAGAPASCGNNSNTCNVRWPFCLHASSYRRSQSFFWMEQDPPTAAAPYPQQLSANEDISSPSTKQ
jgi:hypothetical protein